jgi:hypothetical protein
MKWLELVVLKKKVAFESKPFYHGKSLKRISFTIQPIFSLILQNY